MKNTKTQCRAVTKKGMQCKYKAKVAGYCKLHYPKYPYPILDTSPNRRDRLQDAANLAGTLGGLVSIIDFCTKMNWHEDLRSIFYELEPVVSNALSLADLLQSTPEKLKVEVSLYKWYDSIEQQELEYRIYKTFETKHDFGYDAMMKEIFDSI